MTVTIRRSLILVVCLLVAMSGVFVAQRANAASSTPVVYVATGENFPDALGAASAAAVQRGPVLLVQKDGIPTATAGELTRLSPDVIYVAGGSDVVSDGVFAQLKAFAASVIRVEGRTRYETAVEVSKSAFPVAATGGGDVAALTAAVNALTARVSALEADNTALKATLSGVSRNGDTLLFTGMNLQVVNGLGQTDSKNTLGNLIIGYNEDDIWTAATRSGSHYLVVGSEHTYSAFGGIVAGYVNTASGEYASVIGGSFNTASGESSLVSGGSFNAASGESSLVSGGGNNTASGKESSVSGGSNNAASGYVASVTGGSNNTAEADYSSVSGGYSNTAKADYSSVPGGDDIVCNPSTRAACGEGAIVPPD